MEIIAPGTYFIKDGTNDNIIINLKNSGSLIFEIGEKCKIDFVSVFSNPINISVTNKIGSGSIIHTNNLWLAPTFAKFENILFGRESQAYDLHIFVCKGNDELKLETTLSHVGEKTRGNINVRGIVRDKAKAILNGMIKIGKNGSGADSILKEHVLLLDHGASAIAKPDLEIENNDVSSTHSASVSEIDEEKLFYLCSRGITHEDAKKIFVQGFLLANERSKVFEKEILLAI